MPDLVPLKALALCVETCISIQEKQAMSLTKEEKNKLIEEYKIHDTDTGSTEVQIAMLTKRILQLTEHLKIHKHDESTRRGLIVLVGQRRRFLAYLRKKNYSSFQNITQKLNLRSK